MQRENVMEVAALKAYVPRALKRRAFATFALLDINYSHWTRQQLEKWLAAVEMEAKAQRAGWHEGDANPVTTGRDDATTEVLGYGVGKSLQAGAHAKASTQ
jgi:hypothetical protein